MEAREGDWVVCMEVGDAQLFVTRGEGEHRLASAEAKQGRDTGENSQKLGRGRLLPFANQMHGLEALVGL